MTECSLLLFLRICSLSIHPSNVFFSAFKAHLTLYMLTHVYTNIYSKSKDSINLIIFHDPPPPFPLSPKKKGSPENLKRKIQAFGFVWSFMGVPKSVVELLACRQGCFGRHRNGHIWMIIPHCLMWCLEGKE